MGYGTWNVQYGYTQVTAATAIGTPMAASTATQALPIHDRPSIKPGITWHDQPKARNHPILGLNDVVLVEKRPTFSFSCDATAYNVSDFVYALLQGITSEAVGAPFLKSFKYAGANVSMDLAGTISALFFPHMLEVFRDNPGMTGTDRDEQLSSAIPTQIVFSRQNGVLNMAVDMVGFESDIKGVNYTGTMTKGWGTTGQKLIAHLFLKIDTGGGDVVVPMQEFTITIPNGSNSFPYTVGTTQTILHSGTPPTLTASFQIPMDKAAAQTLWTLADPAATPFVQGPLQPTQAKFMVYGPRSTSDVGSTESDVSIAVRTFISDIDAGGGTDQQLTTVQLKAVYDGTNEPIVVLAADNTDRAWT